MRDLTFNQWQDHLTKELKKDYKKLYHSAKIKQNENKFQKVSRGLSSNLHRV